MQNLHARIGVPVAVLGLFPAAAVHAQGVLYVDAARGDGLNNGSSWTDAYVDLQSALENASTNALVDEVLVAQGFYLPDRGTGDPAMSFRLLSGVALRGGFAGAGAPDPQVRNTSANLTVLSGDLAGDDAGSGNAENSFHVVDASGVDASSVMDGFTIQGGNADGPAPHHSGGGMRNVEGRPTLLNCTFADNAASQDGGAVHNLGRGATPQFLNCVLEHNTTLGRGGAMFNDNAGSPDARVALTGCVLRWNDASSGGALYNFGGGARFTDCTLEQNTAFSEGGAAYNFTSDAVFESCTFTSNAAVRGGAVRNASSRPGLARCVFAGNVASDDGGAMLNQNAGPSLIGCAFVSNTAGDEGGALWSFNTLAFAVRNCTFSHNAAGDKGGAVYNWGTTGGGSSPQLSSGILWNNRDLGGTDESAQMHTDRGTPTVNYSCAQGLTGLWGGLGNVSRNPRLSGDGIHLLPLSSAIDRGDPGLTIPAGETDLDGDPRIARGRVDMGADETTPPTSPPSSSQPIQ